MARVATGEALLKALAVITLALCIALPVGCADSTVSADAEVASADAEGTSADTVEASSSAQEEDPVFNTDSVLIYREDVPLTWNATTSYTVGSQGATGLWGTCGECVIANTLNLLTGSTYTEQDIVDFVMERGLCDKSSGGMSVLDMVKAYKELLPTDYMDARAYFYGDAPTIEEMADLLERGILLNVSVDGEMMREGGHVDEGPKFGTHWLVVHNVVRDEDWNVAGFWIIDSASSITYLTADELSSIYFGHDGTRILDPTCVQIFGWRHVIDSDAEESPC